MLDSNQLPFDFQSIRFAVSILKLVSVAGFEPATSCPPNKCASRLRYTELIKQDDVVSPGIEPLFQLRSPIGRPGRTVAPKSGCCIHPKTWWTVAESNC